MDETFWRIINGSLSVIGITGSDNRKLVIDVNFKDGFTAVFLISADGEFHKTTLILKGKTANIYNKTQLIDDSIFFRKYTESGWLDLSIMIHILIQINTISKGKKCLLILDCWKIHTESLIKQLAEKLNIKLLYVPVGMTSTNQPLDVSINGTIKGIGKHISREIFLTDPFSVPTIKDSIKTLIESIKKIKKSTIIDSFTKACMNEENYKYQEKYKKIKQNEKEKEMSELLHEYYSKINHNKIECETCSDTDLFEF